MNAAVHVPGNGTPSKCKLGIVVVFYTLLFVMQRITRYKIAVWWMYPLSLPLALSLSTCAFVSLLQVYEWKESLIFIVGHHFG